MNGPEECVVRERARGEARGRGGRGRRRSRCCARPRRAAGRPLVRRGGCCSSRCGGVPCSCSSRSSRSSLEHCRSVTEQGVLPQGREGAEGRGAVFLFCFVLFGFRFQGRGGERKRKRRKKRRRHRFPFARILHPRTAASNCERFPPRLRSAVQNTPLYAIAGGRRAEGEGAAGFENAYGEKNSVACRPRARRLFLPPPRTMKKKQAASLRSTMNSPPNLLSIPLHTHVSSLPVAQASPLSP